jgi:hypothetical protein
MLVPSNLPAGINFTVSQGIGALSSKVARDRPAQEPSARPRVFAVLRELQRSRRYPGEPFSQSSTPKLLSVLFVIAS